MSRILVVMGFFLMCCGLANMVPAGMAGQPTLTLTTGGLVLIGLCVGLPACLAYYYFKASLDMSTDPEKIGVETLAKLANSKPNKQNKTAQRPR